MKPKTVDEYIAFAPEQAQVLLARSPEFHAHWPSPRALQRRSENLQNRQRHHSASLRQAVT